MVRLRGSYLHDIGLLFVDFPVQHAAFVRAICLSSLEPPFATLEDPLLLGWGEDTLGRRPTGLKLVQIR